jgi:hypothetical protein
MAVRRSTVAAPDVDDYLDRDDEDERPSRTKAKTSEPDTDTDEDPDEDPDEFSDRSSIIQAGWGAAKKQMAEASTFTNDFKFTEDPQVVKFLTSEPFAFKQHWLDNKSGKKSYVCIGSGCPLCRVLGHTPSSKYSFQVVNLSEEGMPIQLLTVGPRLTTQLEKQHSNERTGPLERNFWALSRTGKKSNTAYTVQVVKPRDLADDYDLDADEVDAHLAEIKPMGADAVYINSKAELLEIANELAD